MSSESLLISRLMRLGIPKGKAEKLVGSMKDYEVRRALADGSFLLPLLRERAHKIKKSGS